MNLGAEPKKIAILGGLLAVAGVVLYLNVFQDDSTGSAPRPAAPAPRVVAEGALPLPVETPARRREQQKTSVSEFKPRQGYARPEDKPDPATIDPTLQLALLAKVQSVEITGASRNVFQYGAAPPPPKPVELPKNTPAIPINNQPPAAPPATAPPPAPPKPAPPTAPPMTFKYYGFKLAKATGRREAFLLDGDDIIIAAENDVLKRGRYRVVRIAIGSIIIEDTEFKSTQTLQLQEDAVV